MKTVNVIRCRLGSGKNILAIVLLVLAILFSSDKSFAQYARSWDKTASEKDTSQLKWFREAKFGLFMHWGLYSKLAGDWEGKRYYGSGEWLMWQAKIPAATYEKVASTFNPVNFDADGWAKFAKEAGIRYLVITAKHHEGFSMYDSKISDFNIVKASPYGKDPMKLLAEATRKQGIRFGFYYSQYLDWHEKNGGGNDWDFNEKEKDYLKYYREKSIPQLRELLSNYGPLGILWFDQPGGLNAVQTKQLVDSLHQLQPDCLFSSRVGEGLGDYTDFGDSEIPPAPIKSAWESIYTHNDSWGYIEHDMNFKSSSEIIRLLASVASKGGNLMLNVGPDGQGNIPYYSLKFLKQTGAWLKQNGESIYSSTYGFIPAQPWGVTTCKPGKIYLHVFNTPTNHILVLPSFPRTITSVYGLRGRKKLTWKAVGTGVGINVAELGKESPDNVIVVEYKGHQPEYPENAPVTISPQYILNEAAAVSAQKTGHTKFETITFSHYFGDWKNVPCIINQIDKTDTASFTLNITEPGDYKIILEYSCQKESAGQEGGVEINNRQYLFRTLYTSDYDNGYPLLFIKHSVAIISIDKAGIYKLALHPMGSGGKGQELFKLKSLLLEPLL